MSHLFASIVPPRLPPELFEIIVELVADLPKPDPAGRRALLACHLVSRSFCHYARRHLFREIEIIDNRKNLSFSLSTLHKLVTWTQPEAYLQGIARYIMEFTFHIETSKAEEVMKELDDDNCLVIVLEALNGTECRIKTAGLWIDSPVGLDWKKFSKRLQHAFLQLFRSPQLRDLRLCGFNRLPLTFLCGAHITRLHLYGCLKETDASQEVLPAEETLPLPELDALVTDHELPVSYFERTISSELESAIDNLLYLYSTIFINTDFAKCLEVIERSNHSLRRLSLRYEAVKVALQSYAGTFDLSNAQRLFNVCLHHYGGIPGPQAPTLGVLEDVIRFCNILRLPTSGSLRCLAFVIPMNQNENCAQFFLDSFHPEHQEFHKWSALDAALGRVCLGGVASIEILILTFEFNGQSKDKIPYGDSFVTAAEALVRKSLTSFAGGEKQKVPRVVIRIVFES